MRCRRRGREKRKRKFAVHGAAAVLKKSKKAKKILVKEEKLCYDIRIVGMNVPEAGLSEWQTRWTQNPLMATSCGFKSRGRHSLAGAKPLKS